MNPPHIHKASREALAHALPDAIKTAIQSYSEFSSQPVPEDPKEFKAHHDACKVAIAHIELLLKLGQLAGAPQEGKIDDQLIAQIKNSTDEVKQYVGRSKNPKTQS